MEEFEELSFCPIGEFFPLPPLGQIIHLFDHIFVVGGGPFSPAVGSPKGGGEILPYCFEFVLFVGFEFVEDAEKENPGEFGDVLQGTGTVRAAHNVTDGFDVAIEALLGREQTPVTVAVLAVAIARLCHR